ncbi:MAG: hypothetical protein ACMUIE_09385 [Thermoplasmatota archaeon]
MGEEKKKPGMVEEPWWFTRGPPPEQDGFQYPPLSRFAKRMKGKTILLVILFLFITALFIPDIVEYFAKGGTFDLICGSIQVCLLVFMFLLVSAVLIATINGRKAVKIGFSKRSLRVHKAKYYFHTGRTRTVLNLFKYRLFKPMFKPDDWMDVTYRDIESIYRVWHFGDQLVIDTGDYFFYIEVIMYENFSGYYRTYLAKKHGPYKDIPRKERSK